MVYNYNKTVKKHTLRVHVTTLYYYCKYAAIVAIFKHDVIHTSMNESNSLYYSSGIDGYDTAKGVLSYVVQGFRESKKHFLCDFNIFLFIFFFF